MADEEIKKAFVSLVIKGADTVDSTIDKISDKVDSLDQKKASVEVSAPLPQIESPSSIAGVALDQANQANAISKIGAAAAPTSPALAGVAMEAPKLDFDDFIKEYLGELNSQIEEGHTDFFAGLQEAGDKLLEEVNQSTWADQLEKAGNLMLSQAQQEEAARNKPAATPPPPPKSTEKVTDVLQDLLGKKMGGVIDKTSKTFEGIQNSVGAASRLGPALSGALGGISGFGPALASAAGVAGGAFAAIAPVAIPVAVGLAATGAALVGLPAMFAGATLAASHFVQVLNPGAVQVLNFAFKDLSAVIGTGLLPLVEAAIPIFQSFNATLFPLAQQFAGVLTGVMGAFSPMANAFIHLFGAAGSILMPVINSFAVGFAQLSPFISTLLTTVAVFTQALQPAISVVMEIANVFLRVLGPALSVVASVFQAGMAIVSTAFSVVGSVLSGAMNALMTVLGPVLNMFSGIAEVVGAVAGGFQTLMAGFSGLAAGIAGLFGAFQGDGLRGVISRVVNAFQWLVDQLILGAARFAKMFGATSFIKGMADSMGGPKESATGLAAAQNPAFKSALDATKDMTLKAAIATASGSGGKDPAQERQEKMVSSLNDIAANGTDLIGAIKDLPRAMAAYATGGASEKVGAVVSSARNADWLSDSAAEKIASWIF